MLEQATPHEDVHDADAQRGRATRSAMREPARLRDVDPERRRLEETMARAGAGVRTGERERFRDRALGVGRERDRAGEPKDRGAPASEHLRAAIDPRAIDPRRIAVEVREERAQRRRSVVDRVDAFGQRAIEHRAADVVAAREVDLVDEGLRERIRVVVHRRDRLHDVVGGRGVEAEHARGERADPTHGGRVDA